MRRLVLPALLLAACQVEPRAPTRGGIGESAHALTADQCAYFVAGGRTTICHATGSARNPIVVLRVAEAACANAHASHPGDRIAVDGDCGPNACLPETAPCDATLRCCDGLSCQAGYCTNVDACQGNACGAHATCTDLPPPAAEDASGRTCACDTGYAGDAEVLCSDIDACAAAPCGANATCADQPAPALGDASGRTCACNAGFEGDPERGCTPVDSCATRPCGANATCTNTSGGRTCACNAGYTGDAELGCTDIDECAVNNGGCATGAGPVQFAISPRSTWLQSGLEPPRVIDLAALGISAGDTLTLEMVGDFSYVGIPNEGILLGAFSTSTGIGGRIDAGTDVVTTCCGGDIAEDFAIGWAISRDTAPDFRRADVTVPAGARFLLVMMLDDYYGDNPLADDDLAVRITSNAQLCVNTPGSHHCASGGRYPIYIVERGTGELSRIDRDGTVTTVFRGLSDPLAVVFLPNGNLLVSERGRSALTEITTAGVLVSSVNPGFSPNDLMVDTDGTIYAGGFSGGLFRKHPPDPGYTLFSSIPGDTTGLRRVGSWIYQLNSTGTLFRIDAATGAFSTVLAGLDWAGVEVLGSDLLISGGRIQRVSGLGPGETPRVSFYSASSADHFCDRALAPAFVLSVQASPGSMILLDAAGVATPVVPPTGQLDRPRGCTFSP